MPLSRLRTESWTVRLLQLLFLPAALPAWGLESVVRRRRGDFQLAIVSAIPFFLLVTALATTLVLVGGRAWALIGIVFLADMELIGLAASISVALGVRSAFGRLLARVLRRRVVAGADRPLGQSVVAAVVAFGYSIWFFTTVAVVLARFQDGAFQGMATGGGRARLLWDCFYYSATTITTANSTVAATGVPAQAAALAEITIGLIFMIFVIAVLAGRLTSRPDD